VSKAKNNNNKLYIKRFPLDQQHN